MAAKDKNLGHCPVRRDFEGIVKVAKTNMIFLKSSKDSSLEPRMSFFVDLCSSHSRSDLKVGQGLGG